MVCNTVFYSFVKIQIIGRNSNSIFSLEFNLNKNIAPIKMLNLRAILSLSLRGGTSLDDPLLVHTSVTISSEVTVGKSHTIQCPIRLDKLWWRHWTKLSCYYYGDIYTYDFVHCKAWLSMSTVTLDLSHYSIIPPRIII